MKIQYFIIAKMFSVYVPGNFSCFVIYYNFGACREACINFLELCKQKNEDKLWIDEIAAMQASAQRELPYLRTSGIILAGEDDTSSKLNGINDAPISESTPSHASFEGQGSVSQSLPSSEYYMF